MSGAEVLASLAAEGVEVAIRDGGRLGVRRVDRGPIPDDVRVLVREHRVELLALLSAVPTVPAVPTVEAACVGAFGPSGRLYPLLRREVRTPHGTGVLVRVFADSPTRAGAMVRYDVPGQAPYLRDVRCNEVGPVPGAGA